MEATSSPVVERDASSKLRSARWSMAIEDDDKPKRKIIHDIGQDLSLLSVDELGERIGLLSAEIERLQAAITRKRASRDTADRFFKS
jgi:uncharacterized small protein (DUF1192 family)